MSSGDTKQSVQGWWNKNPQLYGETYHATEDASYFQALDDAMLNWRYDGGVRYEEIIRTLLQPDKFKGKQALEIGYGSGWLIGWMAKQGVEMTGIDLTERANKLTKRRFELFGLKGRIDRGDAENQPYPDASFDLVYSIGVLHHTPNTSRTIDEVFRMLRPGGRTVIMLYSRDTFFAAFVHLVRGWLERECEAFPGDNYGLWRRWTDGWEEDGNQWTVPFTEGEIAQMFGKFTNVQTVSFYFGFPHPIARLIPGWARRALAGRYGWFRYIVAEKPA